VNVGSGQPRRRAPERVPVGAILVKLAIHRECVHHRALDSLIDRKLGVLHAHRAKDILIVRLFHRLPGGPLNDLARDDVVGVGVLLAHLAVADRVVDQLLP
jgi:hypothetical protein